MHDGALVVLASLLSAASSVVTTLAVFSSRLAVMRRDHAALATQVERDRVSDAKLLDVKFADLTKQLETQERLQRAILDVVAGIASKEGNDQRRTDVLTRYMVEESQK